MTFTKRAENVKTIGKFTSGLTWYITNDNKLYGCGRNNYNQQGAGDTTSSITTFTKRSDDAVFLSNSTSETWYIDSNGDLYGCGANGNGQQGNGTGGSGATYRVKTFENKMGYLT